MYLSKVHIDWALSRNRYGIHQQLWKLFAHRPEAKRDFLFRVEVNRAGHGAELLMQSARMPDKGGEQIVVLACKPYSPALYEGQSLRFRLTANPIRTIKDEAGRKNGNGQIKACRVPLIDEEQQQAWIMRKLKGAAQVRRMIMRNDPPLYFRKYASAGKIAPVTFDGLLTVQNDDALIQLIREGIGPAKAFGCGLLSIAPG